MTQKVTTPPSTPIAKNLSLAVLPLRDVVVFPHMVIPLFVGRKKSIKALEVAMQAGKQIMLVAQKSASDDDPTTEQIHSVGTVATILQLLRLPDGTVKVLVEGEQRANLLRYVEAGEYFSADVEIIESTAVESPVVHVVGVARGAGGVCVGGRLARQLVGFRKHEER